MQCKHRIWLHGGRVTCSGGSEDAMFSVRISITDIRAEFGVRARTTPRGLPEHICLFVEGLGSWRCSVVGGSECQDAEVLCWTRGGFAAGQNISGL